MRQNLEKNERRICSICNNQVFIVPCPLNTQKRCSIYHQDLGKTSKSAPPKKDTRRIIKAKPLLVLLKKY